MPSTRVGTGNLTFGTRHLRISGKLSGRNVEAVLSGVVQNFDRAVRNEVLNDAAVLLQRRAVEYVREGKRASRVPSDNPRSFGLERAIDTHLAYSEKDTLTLDLSDIPYAAMHNAPLGSYTIMGSGEYIKYRWWRHGGMYVTTFAGVRKPGIAFLDRAVEDVRKEMPRIIERAIMFMRDHGEAYVDPRTGGHLRGAARLKGGAKARLQQRLGK